jgi:hypothetical protein
MILVFSAFYFSALCMAGAAFPLLTRPLIPLFSCRQKAACFASIPPVRE